MAWGFKLQNYLIKISNCKWETRLLPGFLPLDLVACILQLPSSAKLILLSYTSCSSIPNRPAVWLVSTERKLWNRARGESFAKWTERKTRTHSSVAGCCCRCFPEFSSWSSTSKPNIRTGRMRCTYRTEVHRLVLKYVRTRNPAARSSQLVVCFPTDAPKRISTEGAVGWNVLLKKNLIPRLREPRIWDLLNLDSLTAINYVIIDNEYTFITTIQTILEMLLPPSFRQLRLSTNFLSDYCTRRALAQSYVTHL